jgi:molybdate transport system ATP-binding protein
MIAINIEKKMRTYKGYEQLKVDNWLPANSITKISGPSGSGKTTLLKIIGGLIIPEKGKLSFDGQLWLDTDQGFALPPQKRNIGFVFQHYALFPNMTVLQHLQYATNDAAWIDRLLHFGKLETLVKHKPEFLSGGQQQRLAILRALATKPRLLLMDEPFSALDYDMRSELIRDLYSLIKELDASCIIVSHNPNEIEHMATHHIKIGY